MTLEMFYAIAAVVVVVYFGPFILMLGTIMLIAIPTAIFAFGVVAFDWLKRRK